MNNKQFTIKVIALPEITNLFVDLLPVEVVNEVSKKYDNGEDKNLCHRFIKVSPDLFKKYKLVPIEEGGER